MNHPRLTRADYEKNRRRRSRAPSPAGFDIKSEQLRHQRAFDSTDHSVRHRNKIRKLTVGPRQAKGKQTAAAKSNVSVQTENSVEVLYEDESLHLISRNTRKSTIILPASKNLTKLQEEGLDVAAFNDTTELLTSPIHKAVLRDLFTVRLDCDRRNVQLKEFQIEPVHLVLQRSVLGSRPQTAVPGGIVKGTTWSELASFARNGIAQRVASRPAVEKARKRAPSKPTASTKSKQIKPLRGEGEDSIASRLKRRKPAES